MKYEDLQKNIIGIYKISFPNDKIYIGLSKDIKRRIKEHWANSKALVCDNAINKYYNDINEIEIEVLEQFEEVDYEILGEREKYWIQYYSANDRRYGYNILEGGIDRKGFIYSASCFNEQDIDNIYQMLLEGYSNKFIAEKYNVSPDTISCINTGKRYRKMGYSYPLRPGVGKDLKGYNSSNNIGKDKVQEIISLLTNTSLTYEEIADKTKTSYGVVFRINHGKTYHEEEKEYPIRKTRANRNLPLSKEKVNLIKNELKNGVRALKELAEYYDCSYQAIVSLNDGKTFYDKNESYPLRITKNHPKKPVSTILGTKE